MVMISFRSKKDKEHLLEKAKKMEDYAATIVECLEESDYDEDMNYRHDDYDEDYSRYGYRKLNKRMR